MSSTHVGGMKTECSSGMFTGPGGGLSTGGGAMNTGHKNHTYML